MAEEKRFENKLKDWFGEVGIYPAGFPSQKMKAHQIGWYFKVWGGGFQKAGIPDIISNINGRFFGIELKGPKGKPSDLQIKNLKMIDDAGGYAVLLYPSDFELFKNLVLCSILDKENARINYNLIKKRWWIYVQ